MIPFACMCEICVVRGCRSNAGAAKIAITFRGGIITSRLGFPTQFRSRFLLSCRNFLQQPSAFFHSYICPFWRYLLYFGKRCVFCPTGRDAANKSLQPELKRKYTLIGPVGMPLPFDVADMQLTKNTFRPI
jgi:hypothetical protein